MEIIRISDTDSVGGIVSDIHTDSENSESITWCCKHGNEHSTSRSGCAYIGQDLLHCCRDCCYKINKDKLSKLLAKHTKVWDELKVSD